MKRPIILVVAALTFVAGCMAGSAGSTPSSNIPSAAPTEPPLAAPTEPSHAAVASSGGCTLPDLGFDLFDASDDGDRYGGITTPIEHPIWSHGERFAAISEVKVPGLDPVVPQKRPNDLPVQAIMVDVGLAAGAESDPASVRLYFSKDEIGPDDSLDAVLAGGGAFLAIAQAHGQDAALVLSVIGDNGTLIKVGPYDAALTHASPRPRRFRTWNLYWSDGVADYSLIVNGSASEAIASAQSMYCP